MNEAIDNANRKLIYKKLDSTIAELMKTKKLSELTTNKMLSESILKNINNLPTTKEYLDTPREEHNDTDESKDGESQQPPPESSPKELPPPPPVVSVSIPASVPVTAPVPIVSAPAPPPTSNNDLDNFLEEVKNASVKADDLADKSKILLEQLKAAIAQTEEDTSDTERSTESAIEADDNIVNTYYPHDYYGLLPDLGKINIGEYAAIQTTGDVWKRKQLDDSDRKNSGVTSVLPAGIFFGEDPNKYNEQLEYYVKISEQLSNKDITYLENLSIATDSDLLKQIALV